MVILVVDRGLTWLTAIALGIVGLSVIPIIGVGYSFWAELAYPVGEAMSVGVMQVVSSIFSTLITLAFNFILGNYGGTAALGTLGGLIAVGTILALFLTEELNKTNTKYRLGSNSFSLALLPDWVANESDQEPKTAGVPTKLDKSLDEAFINKQKNLGTYS